MLKLTLVHTSTGICALRVFVDQIQRSFVDLIRCIQNFLQDLYISIMTIFHIISFIQSCLEKLHMVTEANEKLVMEADKQQLIAALEQCVNLKDELQQCNTLCEQQVNQ